MDIKDKIEKWLRRHKSGSIVTSALAREKGITEGHRLPFRQVCRQLGYKEHRGLGRCIGFEIP